VVSEQRVKLGQNKLRKYRKPTGFQQFALDEIHHFFYRPHFHHLSDFRNPQMDAWESKNFKMTLTWGFHFMKLQNLAHIAGKSMHIGNACVLLPACFFKYQN
jgi:hypothetical protein